MADLVISVKIKDETAQGSSKIKSGLHSIGSEAEKATGKTKSLANVDFSGATQNLRQYADRIKQIGSSAGSYLSSFLGNVASNAVSFLTSKLYEGGKALLDYSAKMQTTGIAFSVLLQSGEKAKTLLNDLKKFAADTPFEFPEIAEASKSLLAFGVAQEKIIPTLRNIGDIASGVGIPLKELAEIYGKAKVQGRLFSEDINQLTGRGIPIIQELAKQFGVSESKVKELVEQGKVGFPQLEKAFEDLTKSGGQFSGMMKAQSATFSGAWSSILDVITQSSATAFEPFFNEISDFSVNFANNLQSQEGKANTVAFAFGASIGQSLKKGYQSGTFSGKNIIEFLFSTPITEWSVNAGIEMGKGVSDGFNKNVSLSWADLRKLDDTIGQVKDKVKSVPPISNQLDADKAKKQAQALEQVINNLNDQLAFFGQTSEVAATKQKLINIGIYDFNNANAKTALSVASAIDKLKEAQEATEKYNSELKSTRDELQKLRDSASFEINFPNNTELNKFDSFVKNQAQNFRELKSEIESTRDALQNNEWVKGAKDGTKVLSNELKRIQNEIDSMLNPDTSKLNNALKEISNNLGFKGIRFTDNSIIDGTDSYFSTKIQAFITQYKEATKELKELDNDESLKKLQQIKLEWKNLLTSFENDKGVSIIGDKAEEFGQVIDYILKLADAIDVASGNAAKEVYNDVVSDLDSQILDLNVKLGRSAELSKADAIAKMLQSEAYKNLTPEMREAIRTKAEEIDKLQQTVKAQQEYQNAFKKTADIFEDALTKLTEGNWKGFFDSILSEMKRFLIRAAAEWLASKFFKLVSGQGQNGNSGGGFSLGNILGGLFGGGNSGNGGGIFSGNQGGAIWNFNSSGSSASSGSPVGGGQGGIFGFLRNIFSGGSGQTGGTANPLAGLFSAQGISSAIASGGITAALALLPTLLKNTSPAKGLLGGLFGFVTAIFNRSKLRKEEEKIRTQTLLDSFEALKQFDTLISEVRTGRISPPSSAISQGEALGTQIKTQYLQIANSLKDKKTRNIAIKDVSRIQIVIDQKMAELRSVVGRADGAREIDEQLNTNFATGVFIDNKFAQQYAQFKKQNGLISGVFDAKDDILARLSKGEMVLNPDQISKVIQNADGRDVFKGAGIPNYSTGTFVNGNNQQSIAPSPSSSPSSGEKQPLIVKIYQSNSGITESEILDVVIEGFHEDYDLQTELVETYDKMKVRKG